MKEIVKVYVNENRDDSVEVTLAEQGESARIVAFYVGECHLNLDYKIIHEAPDTTSEIYTYGILDGASEKNLTMTIDFKRGSAGSEGSEKEEVVLLSNNAKSHTKPLIYCGEEKVHGVHGASVGHLNEREVSYLMSRGIDEKAAREMLVRAKIVAGLNKIVDQKMRADAERKLKEFLR